MRRKKIFILSLKGTNKEFKSENKDYPLEIPVTLYGDGRVQFDLGGKKLLLDRDTLTAICYCSDEFIYKLNNEE